MGLGGGKQDPSIVAVPGAGMVFSQWQRYIDTDDRGHGGPASSRKSKTGQTCLSGGGELSIYGEWESTMGDGTQRVKRARG